jgi:hypothetical protein
MFKQLTELVANLLFLARDTRENKEALTQLRRETHELADAVEKLSFNVSMTAKGWSGKNWFYNWRTRC